MTARSADLRFLTLIALSLAAALAAGCSERSEEPASAITASEVRGVEAREGSLLAYEYTVNFTVDAADIPARVEGVRAACEDARFGECELLHVQTASGEHSDGEITVRIVPAGVGKLVVLGGAAGEIASRETSAEDLSPPVAETAERLQQVTIQRDQLAGFSKRADLRLPS